MPAQLIPLVMEPRPDALDCRLCGCPMSAHVDGVSCADIFKQMGAAIAWIGLYAASTGESPPSEKQQRLVRLLREASDLVDGIVEEQAVIPAITPRLTRGVDDAR